MTKKQLIKYLIDVKDYGEKEAKKIVSLYGSTYLNDRELKECKEFNN